MKITGQGQGPAYWNRVGAAYRQGAAVREEKEGPARPHREADSVQLSAVSKLIGDLKARLVQGEEIRLDRVEAIRAAVATGTYEVPLEDLADAILKEMGR
ncbi:MAG: flagellar biosynthesis anti-sigma factor FlgM [Moorella sp. (in: firmicutes)]